MRNAVGVAGEVLAYEYLKRQKYKIIVRNFTTCMGEIDIIAYDKTSKTTVFIEVKTRTNQKFGRPAEAVTQGKQHKIRGVALSYLKQNNLLNSACRFDVIEIINQEINHIKNAF